MTPPDASRALPALQRRLGARSSTEFFGRAVELADLVQAAAASAHGAARHVALVGPPGSGRRELLRQTLLHAWAEPAILPVAFDLDELPSPAALWPAFLTELTRHALLSLAERRQAPFDPLVLLTAGAAELPARCAGLGAFVLLPALDRLPRAEATLLLPLLQGLTQLKLPPPVVFIFTGQCELPACALPLLEALRRAGLSTLMSAPPAPEPHATFHELEELTLAPLPLSAARALASAAGARRQWHLAPQVSDPILARLGPWPGWVLAWAAQFRPGTAANGLRAAEEAYLRLLTASGWSRALWSELQSHLSPEQLPALFDLLAHTESSAAQPAESFSAALGLRPGEIARLIRTLAALHLISPRGHGWGGPTHGVLAHWVTLRGESAPNSTSFTARQLDLLTRLIAAPRHLDETLAPALDVVALPAAAIVRAFNGQLVPQVLLNFADYHEALGRLSPQERHAALARASQTLRLPEIVGVAPVEAPFPLYIARGFDPGKYQRSSEHIWLVADRSAARLATTPELMQALEGFRQIRQQLGPGDYSRWVIIGEGASPEALELMRKEKLLCSCREQLQLLSDALHAAANPVSSSAPVNPAQAPAQIHSVPQTGQPPQPHAVIDLHNPAAAPQRELTRLALPAREGNEFMAALFAEKLALRSDFNATDAGKIKTAVLEGVLNAIEHSPNPEKLINLEFRAHPDALEILIENEGAGFDPLSVEGKPDPRAKLTARNKRGWGISLMRQFMDELDYEPCQHGTRLRLLKRRTPAPTAVPRMAMGKD